MTIRALAGTSYPFDLGNLSAWALAGQGTAAPTIPAERALWEDVSGGSGLQGADAQALLRAFVGAGGGAMNATPFPIQQMLQSLNASEGRMPSALSPAQSAMPALLQLSLIALLELLITELMKLALQQGGRDLGPLSPGGDSGFSDSGSSGSGSSGSGAPSGTSGTSGVDPTTPAPTSGSGVQRWRPMVREYAAKYGIPESDMGHFENFVLAMMKVESGGNPNAIGDNGHSVGLFQMHDQGAGHGMSVEQRKDPRVQFDTMMPRFVNAYRRGRAQGLDGAQLAVFIAREAERPVASALPRYGQAYDQIIAGNVA